MPSSESLRSGIEGTHGTRHHPPSCIEASFPAPIRPPSSKPVRKEQLRAVSPTFPAQACEQNTPAQAPPRTPTHISREPRRPLRRPSARARQGAKPPPLSRDGPVAQRVFPRRTLRTHGFLPYQWSSSLPLCDREPCAPGTADQYSGRANLPPEKHGEARVPWASPPPRVRSVLEEGLRCRWTQTLQWSPSRSGPLSGRERRANSRRTLGRAAHRTPSAPSFGHNFFALLLLRRRRQVGQPQAEGGVDDVTRPGGQYHIKRRR